VLFGQVWEIGLDAVEDEAIRRAYDGVEHPVYGGGPHFGSVRKYSDPLLIFLLKYFRPQRYGGAIARDSPAVSPPLAGDSRPTGPASAS